MEQQVAFCTRPDGVRIAYAVAGEGPPLVKVGPWSHLELYWQQPQCRAFYESLARHHTLIRLDKHGSGLSDRDRTEFTVAAEVADLAAVVDHLGLERFALLGCAGECPMAIAYAAEHPDRVSHLILFGAYAHGERVGTKEVRDSAISLLRTNYRLGIKVFADVLASGDDRLERFLLERIHEVATPEMMADLFGLIYDCDVRDALAKITASTLVMHREGDRAIPFALGREVAASIKGARFVRLEGRTNWPEFGDTTTMLDAIHDFLGNAPTASQSTALLRERYEPLDLIGSGGQGEVMRALDHQHERHVALKIRPVGDPDARRALLSEARVLLGLRPHAGLPLVRDDFFADDRYVIVMDWVEGTDLRTLLDQQGDPGLPVGSVLTYLTDVAEALDHLHTHEPPIVHGDVKPANMILTPQGKVVLVDFGIASGSGDKQMGSGTRGYVAPEVATGQGSTPAADIFGLAATAFALLTGQNPEGDWPEWEGFAPSQARSLGRAIRLGLSTDPARRPRRAGELLERLKSWQQASLPTGMVTFLMTDVEGSTPLWDEHPDAMPRVLARHEHLVAEAVESHNGRFIKSRGEGDSTLSVFVKASDAVTAAIGIQRALHAERWRDGISLRVRAAIHTGEAELREGDYYGPTVNRAARIRGVAVGGEILLSQATSQLVSDLVPADIDLVDRGVYELTGLGRAEHIFELRIPGLSGASPERTSEPDADVRQAHNLPARLTSFVGRNEELRELARMLADARLVTIAGMGGAGKTRLALEVAEHHVGRFAHGVWFVDLAPVRDETAVPRTFLVALDAVDPTVDAAIDDAEEAADAATAHLARFLKDRDVLLVVDNCEHLLEASARLVSALLRSCPRVRVLATSRQTLGLSAEHVYKVPPLAPPDADGSDDVATLESFEAVRLFCDRARAARSGFHLTPDNATGVADVCRKLDGIPLAIELAAARTNVLTPEQIAERLGASLDLLEATSRDAVERHRTLETALEWSFNALDEPEQALLRRLAVFNSGWTLRTAEDVCTDGSVERRNILGSLSNLVDRSLVIADEQGHGVRYRLLEPVRQFAETKLVAAADDVGTRERHLACFIRQVGDESFSLYTSEGRLAELVPDLDNYRAAMRWAIERRDADAAMRLASALNSVFVWMGHLAEANDWLSEALAIGDGSVSDLIASTIGTLAANLDLGGDARRAVELQRQAAAMFEQLGNRPSLMWSLVYLGHSLHFRADQEEYEVYERALAIALELDDNIAASLIPFLQAWERVGAGDVGAARRLIAKVTAVGEGGHPGARVGLPAFEGLCDFLEGQHEEGSRRCDVPIATLLADFVDAAGNEDPMGLWFLHIVGIIEVTQQPTRERGRARLADLVRRARRTGLLAALPNVLDSAAALIALEGSAAKAAVLFGANDRLRRDTGVEMRCAVTQEMVDRGRETARRRLGPQKFDIELARGAALSLPEALDLASELLDRPYRPDAAAVPSPRQRAEGSSPTSRTSFIGRDKETVSEFPSSLQTHEGLSFVGRVEERTALKTMWNHGTPSTRLVLIAGEPGAGKTRLATVFARDAYDDGATVLFGRCDDGLAVPFQPFVETLTHYAKHADEPVLGPLAPELTRLLPELAHRVDGEPLKTDPETEQYRVFEAVREWLDVASNDRPILLVLDDLQWATRPTLLMLRHVMRSTHAGRFLIVGTYRDTEPGALVDVLPDLQRAGAEALTLAGLTTDDVAELVADDETAARVVDATGGNAFLISEVIREGTDGIPRGARHLVAQRLSHLSEAARDALRLGAVAGEEFEFAVLARCIDDVQTALDEAIGAHLIRETPGRSLRYRFVHALIRSAIEDDLSATRRVLLHKQIAESIELAFADQLDAHVFALAHHFHAAAPLSGASKAVTYLTKAGDQAFERNANEDAAQLFALALELDSPADEEARCDLLTSLGEAQRYAGAPEHRANLLHAAAIARGIGDGRRMARAVLSIGRDWPEVGPLDEDRVAAIREALELNGGSETRERANLLSHLATCHAYDRGSIDDRRRWTAEAVTIAERCGDAPTLARALGAHLDGFYGPDELDQRLEILAEFTSAAEASGDLLRMHRAAVYGSVIHLQAGDFASTEACGAKARATFEQLRHPELLWNIETKQAKKHLITGEFEDAERAMNDALALGTATGQPDAFLLYAGQLFQLRYEQGRLAELRDLATQYAADPTVGAIVRPMLALLYAETDELSEAKVVLEQLASHAFEEIPRYSLTWLQGMVMVAAVACRVNDRARARQIHDLIAPMAAQIMSDAMCCYGPVHHYLGMLCATLDRPDDADEHFLSALNLHERLSSPNGTARTKVEWAEALSRRGRAEDRERAGDLARQALATAEELGMAGVAAQARALLTERTRPPPPRGD